jgi:hypothetical protein
MDCGAYSAPARQAAMELLNNDTVTLPPPYVFERGEHRPVFPSLGLSYADQCIELFTDYLWNEEQVETVVAYEQYNRDCAEMLLDTGLIDRDMGTSNWDTVMADFIDHHFRGDIMCDPECQNSNLSDQVDTDNWLKAFAFYAVTMNADSPLVNGNNYYLAQAGDLDLDISDGDGTLHSNWKIFPYDFNAARTVFCHDAVCNTRMVHWSIVRPTCESLEENRLVGPLLTDPTLHAQYIEYVREFTETIYGNATFVQELQDHAAAQEPYVVDDFWSIFGAFYSKELSPDAADWREEGDNFPLLPTMKARAEDVRAQLAALDAGTYPRGPHEVGEYGPYEDWEYCPHWQTAQANRSACEDACLYAGCNMAGWTVESYCDEEFGICYHGDYDEECRGVLDGERYDGMEDTADGRETICFYAAGVPVKAAECPEVGAVASNAAQVFGGKQTAMVTMLCLFAI